MKIEFNTVTEYINAGAMHTGLLTAESPVAETPKAIAFKCVKWNSYGNPYEGKAWLPKSQIKAVKNDFYTSGPEIMYLVPAWLYERAGL